MNDDDRNQTNSLANVLILVAVLCGIAIICVAAAFGQDVPPPPDPTPAWLDADPPPITVKDRHKIVPGAQRVRVPVCWKDRWVAVPIRVPAGQPEISYLLGQWKYDFGDGRAVEIELKRDRIGVDYDD